MPQDHTALAVTRLVKQRKVGRHRVSKRLYLQVRPSGAASWLFRYMHDSRLTESGNGKSKRTNAHWAGLGEYPVVDLGTARAKALHYKELLDKDIDPLANKRADRTAKRLGAATTVTFGKCANDYIAEHAPSWKNDRHAAQWDATFNGSTRKPAATAAINDLPVSRIDTALAKEVLAPIWHKTPETANRVRLRCEQVIDFAKAHGYRADPDNLDNPFRWKGHLKHLLADPSDLKKRKGQRHHPALPYGDIAAFMTELHGNGFVSARALEFTILTAARTSEVVNATWGEIDFDKKTWTIPAARMKANREHRVPLSQRALKILAALPREDDNPHVFVGSKRGQPLSDTAMRELMRGTRPDYVPHGFRSTFRDWAAECTNFPREVCEAALAHSNKDKVEDAYRRSDLFAKRRELMAQWATYCATPPASTGASVTHLRARGRAS
jgi:integrase